MAELAYHDFRSFIEEAKKISDYRLIEGADWDGEIGALVESTAELVPQPPMLLFDKVKGYPAGFRVCSLALRGLQTGCAGVGLAHRQAETRNPSAGGAQRYSRRSRFRPRKSAPRRYSRTS